MSEAARITTPDEVDAVVIGAGFAGMYMLHVLRNRGFSVRVFEAGDGVGGTWYWNRYPGARCDVESLQYQFAFSDELQREWSWSERYAAQPEILRYANHVADRFDLKRDIEFETRVESATFHATSGTWTVTTDRDQVVTARFVITAVGCLSASRVPDFPGLESFRGEWYHTGRWPHGDVDFTGKRVGVIGTGSSGIQSIPVIAESAESVVVFQRTPNFSVPARNEPLTEAQITAHRETFMASRSEPPQIDFAGMFEHLPRALDVDDDARRARFEELWEAGGPAFLIAFSDLLFDKAANDAAAGFVRDRIREIVSDPEVAEKLCPSDHPIGTKRICVDTDYYATFNRDNVTLVDVRTGPIEEITPDGLRTTDGEYELDVIVFATGFDAMTGPLLAMDIRGRDGIRLADKWHDGPKTYLGLSVSGFPNLFVITGPGSPSVLSNMIVSIEQHVDWIADCLTWLRERDIGIIEARPDAEEAWVEHVNAVADTTLFPQANSWYVGANIPGKPRVFMPYVGGIGAYRVKCDEVANAGYAGFSLETTTGRRAARAREG
ncbi:MAG: NAD(P)/FAD-dependent oxidoreductase [Pseudomonadales bacterium]|jgi:cyclohexanone monooxygenase